MAFSSSFSPFFSLSFFIPKVIYFSGRFLFSFLFREKGERSSLYLLFLFSFFIFFFLLFKSSSFLLYIGVFQSHFLFSFLFLKEKRRREGRGRRMRFFFFFFSPPFSSPFFLSLLFSFSEKEIKKEKRGNPLS